MSTRLMYRPFRQAFVDAIVANLVRGFKVMHRAFSGMAQHARHAAESLTYFISAWKEAVA